MRSRRAAAAPPITVDPKLSPQESTDAAKDWPLHIYFIYYSIVYTMHFVTFRISAGTEPQRQYCYFLVGPYIRCFRALHKTGTRQSHVRECMYVWIASTI